MNTEVGVAFCGAVVCGTNVIEGYVGAGGVINPVAYEVVGPMLITFLLIVGVEVDEPVTTELLVYVLVGPALTTLLLIDGALGGEVVPMMTALLPIAAFLVFNEGLPPFEPPQALIATRENAVKEMAMIRGEIRIL